MAIEDVIEVLKKAQASGKKNMVDTNGANFLLSIGIDVRDFGFTVLDNPADAAGKKGARIIAGIWSEVLNYHIDGETVIKCEAGCGKIVVFDGTNLRPNIQVVCYACSEAMDNAH